MATAPETIEEQVLNWPAARRIKLAEKLMASVEDLATPEIEAAWNTEIEARVTEIRAGRAEAIRANRVICISTSGSGFGQGNVWQRNGAGEINHGDTETPSGEKESGSCRLSILRASVSLWFKPGLTFAANEWGTRIRPGDARRSFVCHCVLS